MKGYQFAAILAALLLIALQLHYGGSRRTPGDDAAAAWRAVKPQTGVAEEPAPAPSASGGMILDDATAQANLRRQWAASTPSR